jgi:O-antigen/teichoic acid export membrane protein
LFADQIVLVVSGKAFLWTFASLASRWSNQVLPFLGIVLLFSFVKQVYNYLFVAVDQQNVLLPINLVGVLVGIPLGIRTIPHYGLLWGAITQLTIEVLFMLGAIWIGRRKQVYPLYTSKIFWILTLILVGMTAVGYVIVSLRTINILRFFIIAILLNLLVVWLSLPMIKKISKWLTMEEPVSEISY